MKMTRQDLLRIYENFTHCKKGYCCYQEDNKCEYDLLELGYNTGIYGWNWTVYADTKTDTLYISCYRNVLSYIIEK